MSLLWHLMSVTYAGRASNHGARNNRRDRVSTLMHPRKAAPAAEAAIKHTTRVARALVKDIQ
jgi:hypothetical protein